MTNHLVGRLDVHRSESGAALVAGLADLLAGPSTDPFTPEVVAVPTQGIERWLAQRLSHRLGAGGAEDGVCANVLFPHPNDVLDEAIAAVSAEHAAAVEAWQPVRTVWQLVAQLAELTANGDGRFALLRHHLKMGQEIPTGRRYALARRIAGLFDEYSSARPDLINQWANGDDQVPGDLAWQPILWRAVREQLGPNPAELLDYGLATIREHPDRIQLPERFSVYGASRIDASRLQVLASLAEHREVHLWLNHASPRLWDDIAAMGKQTNATTPGGAPSAQRLPLTGPQEPRRAAATVQPRNPLLASLSRDIRELQQRLAIVAPDHASTHHPAAERHELAHRKAAGPPDPGADHQQDSNTELAGHPEPSVPCDPLADDRRGTTQPTLLHRLQHALRTDAEPAHDHQLDPADRSVQIHACHGRARQVEVLRDVILGLLADDPTLEPRDILVMCPDVDSFAPLVTAAFGSDPADRLRVQLADRAPRESNAVLAVVSALLELVAGRVGAPELLALAGMPPVRTRFRLDHDDLEQLRAWTVDASARWGIDEQHRDAWRLASVPDGTWRQAFDRILTGIALGDGDHLFAGVLPLDGLDSGDIDLAGRFAELVDRVAAAVQLLSHDQTAHQWLDNVEHAALSLVDVPRDNAWQVLQLRAELGDIRDALHNNGPQLALADVRALLDDRLAGRPTRTSFRTGGITVCTLVPMRSVPHRVICLLGLDDEAFPRRNRPDGDNLLARDPRIGERDPRSEDRQLFLDAITAATEHLVITFRGAHERTGASLPPAVPVGELLDALDGMTTHDSEVRDHVVIRHPLQPADPRNFTTGALGRDLPLGFDRSALAGARASVRERAPAAAFLDGPLPAAAPTGVVELDVLQRFWAHPVRGFLRQRLELSADWDDDQPIEAIPLDLDGLQRWGIGDRALAARLRGLEPAAILARERVRGSAPPGVLGNPQIAEAGRFADAVLSAADEWLAPAGEPALPQVIDVDVPLADGRRLVGSVRGLRERTIATVTVSNVRPKQRLRAWIDLLAAVAVRPDLDIAAVIVGRRKQDVVRIVLGGVGTEQARQHLGTLLLLRDLGLRGPLPLPLQTTEAYAAHRSRGADEAASIERAATCWASGFGFAGEDADAEHVRVWGSRAPMETLTGWLAPTGLGHLEGESSDFGRTAIALWQPLLDAETRR